MYSLHTSKRRKVETKASIPRYSEEQNALFRTFPETLWILILSNLTEYPKTLFGIAKSSLVLQNLLKTYKMFNCHLFVLVWPILFNKIICKADFLENKKFYQSVTVGCRRVCKTWCTAVDNFFSTHPGHYPNSDKHFQLNPDKALSDWPTLLWALNLRTNWFSIENREFLQHFRSTHEPAERSPFVSGAVVLKYTHERNRNELQDGVIEKYGRFIFHCSFDFAETERGVYDKLTQLITQMPNLKSFHLDRVWSFEPEVIQNALPTLPNLRRLVIDEIYNHHNVAALLQKYSGVLTHLELLGHYPNGTIPLIVCTKLEYVRIGILEPETVSLLDISNNAHTVEIDFWRLPRGSLSYAVQILKEKLDESCRTLILSFQTDPMRTESQGERLCLKNVQRLKLTLMSYMPIDFVLGMKNTLEVLHVVFPEHMVSGVGVWTSFEVWKSQPLGASILEKEEIKALSCLDYMESSNIWDMLPNLKIFRVERRRGGKVEHWERNEGGVKLRVKQE